MNVYSTFNQIKIRILFHLKASRGEQNDNICCFNTRRRINGDLNKHSHWPRALVVKLSVMYRLFKESEVGTADL